MLGIIKSCPRNFKFRLARWIEAWLIVFGCLIEILSFDCLSTNWAYSWSRFTYPYLVEKDE